MGRYDIMREIERLDPVTDNERIIHLVGGYEFPWDVVRSLEIALYRTYCVPSVSALLDQTGEFRLHTQKRYDDTGLLLAEIQKHGYTSERGREAIRRMNRIHAHFPISNDDYLFVLSVFIYDPVRWIDNFGWRKTSRNECLALYYFWREVGKRMNIKNIPDSYEALHRFYEDYQRTHFHYSETNHAVGVATRNLFLSWWPGIFRPIMTPGIYAMLDEPMLDAFGFPHQPKALRVAVATALKLRGRALRFFPPRIKPAFMTDSPQRTYPNGYKISDFGPASMQESLNRSSSTANADT